MTTSASPWTRCGARTAGAEELRLVGALMRFWYVRGHLREGSSRCEEALAAHDDQSQPRLKALFGAALLAHRLGDYQRAEALDIRSDWCSLASSKMQKLSRAR